MRNTPANKVQCYYFRGVLIPECAANERGYCTCHNRPSRALGIGMAAIELTNRRTMNAMADWLATHRFGFRS